MTISNNDHNMYVDLAYQLFTRINDEDFEYIYKGGFSQNISKKLLSLAESNVQKTASKTSLKNKIYFVMVEGLQNVTKHQTEESPEEKGMFAIQKSSDKYFITTGNVINKEDEKSLKPKLEQINILEKDQLTKVRKDILLSGKLSEKGGAGLGLIEMARKSGKQLLFEFKPIDEKASFFYFRTEIPGEKNNGGIKATAPNIISDDSIDDVQKLHDKLEEENIFINFNGKFNRDNILSLLSVIKGQMNVNTSTKKVYGIMVEMLQNISKHTNSNISDIKQNRGIFLLGRKSNSFILTSGNYIHKECIDNLKNKIDKVNNMSDGELHEAFDLVLTDLKSVDAQKTGLGFIDIRIKSNDKINYRFIPIEENLYFFAVEVSVEIK